MGDVMPPIEPAAMTHYVAILNVLGDEVASEFCQMIRGNERPAIAKLSKMSIPDAVGYVRDVLGITAQEELANG